MALQNKEGNYLKIDTMDYENKIVFGRCFRNKTVRYNPTKFDTIIPYSIRVDNIDELFKQSLGTDKSIWEQVITQCYEGVKAINEFKDWTDV